MAASASGRSASASERIRSSCNSKSGHQMHKVVLLVYNLLVGRLWVMYWVVYTEKTVNKTK